MGFFFTNNSTKGKTSGRLGSYKDGISKNVLEKIQGKGCDTCTLNRKGINKFDPVGGDSPDVYVLNTAPYEDEVKTGRSCVGPEHRLLRSFIGSREKAVRYNSVVGCTKGFQLPTKFEKECCRGYVVEDIVRTKPKVILGLGLVPLEWVQGDHKIRGITEWRGKSFPVEIGGHSCWYVAAADPGYLIDKRSKDKKGNIVKTPGEHIFGMDIDFAFDKVNDPSMVLQKDNYTENCHIIYGEGGTDFNTLLKWFEHLYTFESVAIDLETQGLRPYTDRGKILTCAIGDYDCTYAFPVEHSEGWKTRKRISKVHELLKDFLYDGGRPKIVQNLKFEQEWFLYYYGKELLGSVPWEDTMSIAYALDERKKTHSLEFLSMQYFGFNLKAMTRPMNMGDLDSEPLVDVLPYNARDTKYTELLFRYLVLELSKRENKKLIDTYDYHIRLAKTLALTQDCGMYPDFKEQQKQQKEMEKGIAVLEKKMFDIKEVKRYVKQFGSYNPSSPDHNIFIFENYYKATEVDKGQGSKSTDESVLKSVADRIPLAGLLLEHRGLVKVKGTYVDTLEGYTYPDGKIHPNYSHAFTSTGRLSCSDPNAQNWPSRKYKEVRKCIQALKQHFYCSFDYGQIDARNIAMASEDEYYIDALWNGLDIHQDWTDRILEKYPQRLDEVYEEYEIDRDDEEKLIKRYRKDIKNVWTFPLFYGCSVDAAAYHTKIPLKYIKPLYNEFWDTFSGVRKWIDYTIKFYLKHGYVETLNGRRRHGPMKKEELVNATIQGTSAEIVGDAMNRCSELAYPKIVSGRVHCPHEMWQPFIQIHDDIGFYIPDDKHFENNALEVAKVLCDVPFDWVSVPIVVELQAGHNWYDQKVFVNEYHSNKILSN